MAPDDTAASVAAAFKRSDYQLLCDLGASGKDVFPRDAAAKGGRLLANLISSLRESICADKGLKVLVKDHADQLALASALADLLATLTHGIPAVTASVLIVRQGLNRMCADLWQDEH